MITELIKHNNETDELDDCCNCLKGRRFNVMYHTKTNSVHFQYKSSISTAAIFTAAEAMYLSNSEITRKMCSGN